MRNAKTLVLSAKPEGAKLEPFGVRQRLALSARAIVHLLQIRWPSRLGLYYVLPLPSDGTGLGREFAEKFRALNPRTAEIDDVAQTFLSAG